MKTEFLKDLGLEQDAIDKIMAENGRDVEAQKAKATAAEASLAAAGKTIGELQDTVKKFDGVDPAALKQQISDLQKKHDDDLKAARLDYALNARLDKEGAVNVTAVRALLDMGKVGMDGDNLIGVDDQLKALREKETWAFASPDVPGDGGNPAPTPGTPKTPLPSGTVIF